MNNNMRITKLVAKQTCMLTRTDERKTRGSHDNEKGHQLSIFHKII